MVEAALERSRRVEVFVSNDEAKSGVQKDIETFFPRAYKDGKWKVIVKHFSFCGEWVSSCAPGLSL